MKPATEGLTASFKGRPGLYGKLMSQSNLKFERRRFPRFTVPSSEIFAYWVETLKTTAVLNLSLGGFKSVYHPVAQNSLESVVIDFFAIPFGRFHLTGISCRIVYDLANLEADGSFSGISSRICGLEYKKLSPEQNHKLDYLIYLSTAK